LTQDPAGSVWHGGLGSLESIAAVINGQGPDIVALQEVDVLTNRSGRVDQAARLGQLTGMYHAGTIEAIRFYRGTRNGAGYVARLWTSTGALVAEVPLTDGVIPGWQEATLPTPVTVTAGTTYIASYYTSNGLFARDPYGLSAAANSRCTGAAPRHPRPRWPWRCPADRPVAAVC
jgi:hypothetical protein